MKVLDEKGRLFGKINLVDALVVLVVIIIVVGVVWKLLGDDISDAVSSSTDQTLTYEVTCYGVENDLCDVVMSDYVGQLMSNGDLLDGYIVSCAVEPYYASNSDSSGQSVAAASPNKSNLVFTIVFSLPQGDIANTVGSQEVRIGKSHIVKTCDIEITGTVTGLEITDGAPDFAALGVTG